MTATGTHQAGVRRGGVDAVTALSIFIFVLFTIPAQLIVAPLGSAGTPAEILSMALLAVWAVGRIGLTWQGDQPRQPVRLTMLIFVVAVLMSYVAATSRAMMPEEARSADAGLLLVLSWLGILLLAMDGIRTRERLDVVLRRLVLAGGALATLGLLQFATKQAYTNLIQIPGLASHNAAISLGDRNGLTRPAGTTLHPIEFGAVLTMCLPFALHYAIVDTHRGVFRRWYPVLAIAAAIPISISRSAIVSAIVVLCFVIPRWAPVMRRRAYVAIIALSAAGYIAVPGLLHTMAGLFTGISGDSSAQSRTDSFAVAFQFIGRTPIFGRGFQTFLPTFRILDDQYLGLLIETGIFGLAAFLSLLVAGVFTGLAVRRRTRAEKDASLGVAFAASAASALASFALFDAFSFPMATSLIFFVLGGAGALRRLSVPQ